MRPQQPAAAVPLIVDSRIGAKLGRDALSVSAGAIPPPA
jgi:hypothetical protein